MTSAYDGWKTQSPEDAGFYRFDEDEEEDDVIAGTRYMLRVERIGTTRFRALAFRGERLLSDCKADRPLIALRSAIAHVRWLRRTGRIRKECA